AQTKRTQTGRWRYARVCVSSVVPPKTKGRLNKSQILTCAAWTLVVLGLVMIYLGGFHAPQVLLPPIVTGVGFLVIAWALAQLRKACAGYKARTALFGALHADEVRTR